MTIREKIGLWLTKTTSRSSLIDGWDMFSRVRVQFGTGCPLVATVLKDPSENKSTREPSANTMSPWLFSENNGGASSTTSRRRPPVIKNIPDAGKCPPVSTGGEPRSAWNAMSPASFSRTSPKDENFCPGAPGASASVSTIFRSLSPDLRRMASSRVRPS